MQPEYLFKVGNLFVCKQYTWSTDIKLSEHQKDAGRYDLKEAIEVEKFLRLHNVPFIMFDVQGELKQVSTLQQLATHSLTNKETV